MKIKTIVYATILLLSVSIFKASGQAARSDTAKIPESYWATLGFGPSSLGSLSGMLNANFEISHQRLITLSWQNEVSSIFNYTPGNNVQVNTYNVLAGKIYKQNVSFVTVSAGLGLVNVISYDSQSGMFADHIETNQKNRFTVGIPIMVQGYLVLLQTLGLGINGYVNLNPIRSTAGFTINAALGRIATHKSR